MRTLIAFGCAAFFAAAIAPGLSAQNPPNPPASPKDSAAAKPANYAYRYRFLGVYDAASGDPVEGAEVVDVLSGTKALTTKTGTVSLMFLPEGGSLVRIRKLGFEMQTLTVAISPADTAPVTVVLTHSTATTLAPVVVNDSATTKYISPSLRGFQQRMSQGFGRFITEAEFRKDDGKPLANIVLSRIPGVMRTNGPHGESYLVSARKQCAGPAMRPCRNPDCYVTVVQDGVTMFAPGMGTPPDFSRMDGLNYAAAEYYAGGATMPPEFNETANGCGTLLLWTRER